jgi:tRNA threonylcarbamoyladenosine biosynthesis protein TsaB
MKPRFDHGREPLNSAQAPTVLALETSTAACSVALLVGGTIYEDHRIVVREHNRLILVMIDSLIRKSGIDRRDLDAVAFGRGPGSFTGVRIAAGVAQGISLGIGIPVVPVSSLAVLAQTASATHSSAVNVLATLRSRAEEIYVGCYRYAAGELRLIAPESVVDAAMRDPPACVERDWWVVGDGVAHFGDTLATLGCSIDPKLLPTASALLVLATTALINGEGVDSADALPVYLQGTGPWRKLAD